MEKYPSKVNQVKVDWTIKLTFSLIGKKVSKNEDFGFKLVER